MVEHDGIKNTQEKRFFTISDALLKKKNQQGGMFRRKLINILGLHYFASSALLQPLASRQINKTINNKKKIKECPVFLYIPMYFVLLGISR